MTEPRVAFDALRARATEYWRPPPHLSLAAWADAHFSLPTGDPNAGRWRSLPYQRGVLDAISDPGIERVTWMKSRRIGYTKSFCAAVAYFIAHDPSNILIVQPTIEDAEKFSKEDLAPILEEMPALEGLMAPAKSRNSASTILFKMFKGGSLMLVGANSPRGFRRTSRRIIIFDEVDGYPQGAGDEGDQIELAIGRSEYYWNRKILAGSTPTVAGRSRIERMFEDGDQRRYWVPCPHCGEFQVLKFPNLKWPDGHPELAHFVCTANGCVIEHAHKRTMVEGGEWRADAPERFTEFNRHASFHIWAGYSYSPNATWGQLAAEFLKAKHGGPLTFRTFTNQVWGEVWQERGDAPDWEPLMRRREPYRIGTVPRGALFLTAGVDVQKDRVVVEIVGWGRGKTSWSVDYVILPGDTADLDKGPWAALDALLARAYVHDGGTEMAIRLLAVDSGYNTQQVYAWARRYPMNRVVAIKGQPSGGALISAPSPVEVSDRGRKLKRGYKVWPVCGAIAKSELYAWLRLEMPMDGTAAPPGYCHFPEYGNEYFRELTAEQLVTHKTRGGFVRLEWELIPGRSNEALDARVYARAAACVFGLDRFTERDWAALEVAAGQEPEPPEAGPMTLATAPVRPPRQPWIPRRKGWVR